MNQSDLKAFLADMKPTLHVYTAIERDSPADEIVAVALGGLDTEPSWVDRSAIAAAIDDARTVEAAGVCTFVGADGRLLSIPLVDPPREDQAGISDVPRMLPVLETMHRTVDHLVAVFDPATTIVQFNRFPAEDEPTGWSYRVGSADPADISGAIAHDVPNETELLVVAVAEQIQTAVKDRLDPALPPSVKVEMIDPNDDVAEATVMAAANFAAVDLVQSIRTFRFMDTHGAVSDGLEATVTAMAEGSIRRLFLSPTSEELIVNIGSHPRDIALGTDPFASGPGVSVRASDGLIRAAILQGIPVQIFPEHLHDGPQDGVGATLNG